MPTFLVNEKSVCVDCSNKVADKDCICCKTCEKTYHAVCPSAPDNDTKICSKTFLTHFLTNSANKPNFMWQCNSCKTTDEITNVATLKNMIVKMDKTHTEQISRLTDLVTQLVNKVDGVTTANQTATVNNDNAWSDNSSVSKIKSSFLVKPDEQGKKIRPNHVRKIATDKGIPVESVFEKENGDLFVNLPDKESCDEITQVLSESHDTNKVVKLTTKLPTISILNVTAKDMKNDLNEDLSTDEVKNHICRQNKAIDQLIAAGGQLEIVYCRPPPPGKKFYTLAARVSPNIRDALAKMKMKIYLGTCVHPIVDRFHVRRCNLCQSFGHYAQHCTPDTKIVCGFCTESHKSESCPNKTKDHTFHKCSNCEESGLSSVGHSSFWPKCPSYLAAQQKLSKTIAYNYDNLN